MNIFNDSILYFSSWGHLFSQKSQLVPAVLPSLHDIHQVRALVARLFKFHILIMYFVRNLNNFFLHIHTQKKTQSFKVTDLFLPELTEWESDFSCHLFLTELMNDAFLLYWCLSFSSVRSKSSTRIKMSQLP